MTTQADLAPEDWKTVREGPPLAGLTVVTAQRGGSIRETFAMAKAYTEARRQHGASELLDELVGAKPEIDRSRYGSYEELREHGLQRLRDAVAVLERAATPQEVDDYRRFVVTLAEKVANAHREGDAAVSDAERAAIDEISNAVGATGA